MDAIKEFLIQLLIFARAYISSLGSQLTAISYSLMKTFQFAGFNPSLRKKCRYLELFLSAFSRIRTKNCEYGHFSRCASHATGLFLCSLKTLED